MNGKESAPLRLTRAMRLRQSREFADIKARGNRLVRGCLIANWTMLPPGSLPRVGVITSKRLGKAVFRCRARRLLREAFRLRQKDLAAPVAMVLIARASIVGKPFASVDADFAAALKQAKLWKLPA